MSAVRLADLLKLERHLSLGVSAFERSTFGVQLARAELYHVERVWPVPEVTARPRSMREYTPAVEPDDRVMVEYGEISRRLGKMPPRLREAMVRWHGDHGAEWSGHKRGRCVSLFCLVPSGRDLIARERRNASGVELELSDAERLRNAIALDDVQGKDALRRRLITLATREAHALYEAAVVSWEATK